MLKSLPNPCGVYFEKENIDTLDSKSEFLLTILSSLAQEESRSVSENTRWSWSKRCSRGEIHCPTTYFLGYDTDKDGNIIIDEKQAEVVKRIFREYLEGKGTPTIARGLMRDGLLTARGNQKWTGDAVYKILKNEKYMGHCLAQKTVTVDFLTHKRVANKNIQPQYYIKNSLPSIISEEDWNAVQEELKRRKNMLHDPDGKYRMGYSGKAPFSNKLVCGICGRPVIRRRLTSKKKGERYYFSAWQCRVSAKCSKEEITCSSKYVWEEALEKAFMKLLFEFKEEKDLIISDAKKAISECSLEDEEETRLVELENQIDRVTDQISQMAARETATNDPVYDANLRHLIYEQEILQMEHDGLYKNKQESIFLKKHLDELLHYLDEIEEPTDKFRDDIFSKTVERGTLHENYQVEFKFKCGITRTTYSKRHLLK
ncbi:recombinase family protein [Desulfitispora alkaliphila]|uniref:recombinase family protein n=1 Tax=Desulfitispora alkaliphila TaxID=622674 RepID=UPI003D1E7DD5